MPRSPETQNRAGGTTRFRHASLPIVGSSTASPLPPLYAGWMDEILGAALPEEPNATCDNCAMSELDPSGEDTSGKFFDRASKCCTYVPLLFNFLVGRILTEQPADEVADKGRDSVRARIAQGLEVTPIGLHWPRPMAMMYDRSGAGAFGRAQALRCPHYVADASGRCGVWKNRMSVCATWFCKHGRGAVGHQLWRAVEQLLNEAEQTLSWHCVHELDLDSSALAALIELRRNRRNGRLDVEEIDRRPSPARQARIWGRWLGREEEFYSCCAALIGGMHWSDVRALGGPELAIAERLLRDAFDAHGDATVPPVVRLDRFRVLESNAEATTIETYSCYDPVRLPRAVAEALHSFDGRPVEEVLKTLAVESELSLDLAHVRQLLDFQVLTSD